TGMVILGVVGISIFLLLYSLTTQVGLMLEGVEAMNRHFAAVEQSMGGINTTLNYMEDRLTVLHRIDGQMAVTESEVAAMGGYVAGVDGTMTGVSQRMLAMEQHLQTMNRELSRMQQTIGGVGTETRDMSRSLRMMP
ncbi:MAG: hypothetical protein HQL48_04290, partial [Gammaproteobacteria bacterium]|nr:hypothetical protein [Gammaproteobacteria bacterium]